MQRQASFRGRRERVGDGPTEVWMTDSFLIRGFATTIAGNQTNAASLLIQHWGSSFDSTWQIAAFLDLVWERL